MENGRSDDNAEVVETYEVDCGGLGFAERAKVGPLLGDKVGNPLYEIRTHDGGEGDVYSYSKAYNLEQALINCDDPAAEIANPGSQEYEKKIEYNMDDVGNRSSVVETPYRGQGATTTYTTNSLNEYTIIGGVSRSHDDNGNLIDDATNEYYYSWRNQLLEVGRKSDGYVLGKYWFDPLGRRVRRDTEDETVTTRFLYDGAECVEEQDDNENLLRKFAYAQGIDEILWMEAPDQADVDGDQDTAELMRFYYHTNARGSVTHITDANENVVEQYRYSPHGLTSVLDAQANDQGGVSRIGNPYRWMGLRYCECTHSYQGFGYAYVPQWGRVLQLAGVRMPCPCLGRAWKAWLAVLRLFRAWLIAILGDAGPGGAGGGDSAQQN